MAKEVDLNGFWKIEDNPISKEGVFPYLGKQISPNLEPDKIYMVYRPAVELTSEETIESFNGVPFIDEHEMIGEGFTKYDDRPAGGVLFNVKAEKGVLFGDFKIFSEDLQEEISNGKKELSLGYLCDYELEKGVWNGQRYDAIQKNIRGNHVALVNHGRMGSDVRVYDRAITMDALDITKEISAGAESPNESRAGGSLTEPNQQGEKKMKYVSLEEVKAVLKKGLQWGDEENPTEKLIAELLDEKAVEGVIPTGDESPDDKKETEDADVDKREVIRKIMAIAAKPDSDFDDGEEEKIKTIAKLLEESEYNKSESGTANDEDPDEEKKKGEDKCGKDEDDAEKKDDDKKTGEDEDSDDDKDKKDSEDEDDDEDDKAKKAMDSMPKKILKMIAERNEIVKAVEPMIGTFACDEMTPKDAAVYACQKLGLQATEDEALPVLRGFLAAKAKNNKVYGLDSAVSGHQNSGMDKGTQKYLKGE